MNRGEIVLASASASRRIMLEAAGVAFMAVAPNVDEEAVRKRLAGEDPVCISEALAQAKARDVGERHRDALVIGADQILVCEGRIFAKALAEAQARAALLRLRGREHQLISSAVLVCEGNVIWRRTETAQLFMREFSDTFLDEYLTAELPEILGSVGCYRIEGRGVQLFSRIEGDHFTIRGLPLIALLEALRRQGALLS